MRESVDPNIHVLFHILVCITITCVLLGFVVLKCISYTQTEQVLSKTDEDEELSKEQVLSKTDKDKELSKEQFIPKTDEDEELSKEQVLCITDEDEELSQVKNKDNAEDSSTLSGIT